MWLSNFFKGRKNLAKLIVAFFALLVIIAGGIFYWEKIHPKAETLKSVPKAIEQRFVGNQLLIKLSDKGKGKIKKDLKADNTGIEGLDSLDKKYNAVKIEKIFKDKNDDPDLDKWYQITFKGEEKILKGEVSRTKTTIEDQSLTMDELTNDYKNENIDFAQPNFVAEVNARKQKNTPTPAVIQTISPTPSSSPSPQSASPSPQISPTPSAIVNDWYYSSRTLFTDHDDLWGLKNINAASAWSKTTGGNVIVGVVDTGVDYNHPDLKNSILKEANGKVIGYNFVNNTTDPMDDYGHGTHVAGTIAATNNNDLNHSFDSGTRLASVGPGLKILAVKGLDSTGAGYLTWLMNGIVWATDHGAKVINNSWGGGGLDDQLTTDTINYVYNKNVVLVFAAGNSGWDVYYDSPAGNSNVITVGAVNYLNNKACFSNYGDRVDVVAPGGDSPSCGGINDYILSALSSKYSSDIGTYGKIVGNYYVELRGTSMAAPHVASVAGLILAAHPDYSVEEVRFALRDTSSRLSGGWNTNYGFGLIDAAKAVNLTTPPPVAKLDLIEDEYWGGIKSINGTVSARGGVKSWILSRSPYGTSTWTTIKSGTTAVTGQLGEISGLSTGKYELKLEVKDTTGQTSQTYATFSYDAELLNGWPKNLGAIYSSPAVADINNDGKLEIIIVGDKNGQLTVARADGSTLTGFPLNFGGSDNIMWSTSPVVSDIDKDGFPEIIFIEVYAKLVNGVTQYAYKIFAIKHNGQPLTGWPVNILNLPKNYSVSVPTIADINADGKSEILFKTSQGKIYVYNSNGQIMNGWPVTVRESTYFIASKKESPVAVWDINNDGKLEIFVGYSESNYGWGGVIYAYDYNGIAISGWPQTVISSVPKSALTTVGIADVNADSKPEIVAKTSTWYDLAICKVTVFNRSGLKIWSKNFNFFSSDNPIFADINGSPGLEIMFTGDGYDYAWQGLIALTGNGAFVKAIPNSVKSAYNTEFSLADLNGDGKPEILGGGPSGIYAYDINLNQVWGKNIWASFREKGPVIADIDGDNKLEIISNAGNSGVYKTYIWKLNTKSPANALIWPVDRQNNKHYGYAEPFIDVPINDTYYGYILSIYNNAITYGNECIATKQIGSKCYFPNNNVSRQEMATFISRAVKLPLYTGSEQPFKDVPTSSPHYRDIMAVYKAGIASGYPDGTFRPNDTVTRDQMAVFLVRAKNLALVNPLTPSFADVPNTNWAYQYIEALYKAKITNGCSTNPLNYCPSQSVTRKAMAVFLYRAFLGSTVFSTAVKE